MHSAEIILVFVDLLKQCVYSYDLSVLMVWVEGVRALVAELEDTSGGGCASRRWAPHRSEREGG